MRENRTAMSQDERIYTQNSKTSRQNEAAEAANVPQHPALRDAVAQGLQTYRGFWATVLGLACARCSIIIGSYGSYAATDEGLYTDGATIVALFVLLIALAVMVVRNKRIEKRQVLRLFFAMVLVQLVVLTAMVGAYLVGNAALAMGLALHAVNTICGIALMSFWLRFIRGSSMKTIVVLVFSALAVSEIIIFPCALLPYQVDFAVALLATAACFPLTAVMRRHERAYDVEPSGRRGVFQMFVQQNVSNSRFLVIMGVGIAFMALVIGLLRGYPDGMPIPFSLASRVGVLVVIELICIGFIVGGLVGWERLMAVDIWVVLRMMAVVAIVAYAAAPSDLQLGAVVTTALNALMVAFMWYAIVSFMSYGWRDAYYYAIGGFTAFLLPRAIARTAEGFIAQAGVSETLMLGIMALGLVISAEVSFVQYIDLYRQSHLRKERSERSFINRFMGIDNGQVPESLEDMRFAAMKSNAQKVGEQFLLSEREVEVLAFYAMGHTQQRVAEELFISPGTVHAHIKRIYSKTGLHSRQEVLDYLQRYANDGM